MSIGDPITTTSVGGGGELRIFVTSPRTSCLKLFLGQRLQQISIKIFTVCAIPLKRAMVQSKIVWIKSNQMRWFFFSQSLHSSCHWLNLYTCDHENWISMKNKKIVKCVNLSSISISANDFEADAKVGRTYYVKKTSKSVFEGIKHVNDNSLDVPTYLCLWCTYLPMCVSINLPRCINWRTSN